MGFEIGSLVRARGREWVVLPPDREDPEMLVLQPLGGADGEVTGVYSPLEAVESAQFAPPDPSADMGNHTSCSLLRNALRLGFRSGAGPFRSLARIAVEPRPYQIVPLLMALKLDPVRLLIADDVGIGKTVEACLIARELLDRGEIGRLAVLCPPHLAEQWQAALSEQFHIKAELVLSGTAVRLERTCRQDESLFDRYPFTVVSTDYIKSDRHRYEFLRTCPEMVIVDEAHTCASSFGRGSTQQRHDLLRELTDPESKVQRHMVLVSATPHSGNEETFRSLVSLLDRGLGDLPGDLSGEQNRRHRERLARHFVQRRRGDLKSYLDTVTPFPDREIGEEHYELTPAYRKFFDRVLAYCRESVLEEGLERRRQRVRWWSALALLRALGSSPAAAAATLRTRSAMADSDTVEQADAEGVRIVLDLDEEKTEAIDFIPGSDTGEESDSNRTHLLRLAGEADDLKEDDDAKLSRALALVCNLLEEGHSPILYCRFIPTAEYVGGALRKHLKEKGTIVEVVTGTLPPEERERRIEALRSHKRRVLVCTDCMSEGINLQQIFDAVMHYDLSWNPTRHEQREGRVDRYGQPKKIVRTLTYYGRNNPVDGVVLQVLLRKRKTIHCQLGVVVPVPMDTKVIEDAILESLFIRGRTGIEVMTLEGLEPFQEQLDTRWDAAVEREKRSRTLFAQNQLLRAVNDEVRIELEEVRSAIGNSATVKQFATTVLEMCGASVSEAEPVRVDMTSAPQTLRNAIGVEGCFTAVFSGQPAHNALSLTRTHPIIEGLSAYVLESALDPCLKGPGHRCGVVRTRAVETHTTLLLLRARFHITSRVGDGETDCPLLAEDLVPVAFTRNSHRACRMSEQDLERLLSVGASANIGADQARAHARKALDSLRDLQEQLDQIADQRGRQLLEAHRRVRKAVTGHVRASRVETHRPVDVIGVYVFLPVLQQ